MILFNEMIYDMSIFNSNKFGKRSMLIYKVSYKCLKIESLLKYYNVLLLLLERK